MTTVAFVSLTLFTWMVSSSTWLRLDQCTELSQYGHDEETKACSSNALYKNAVNYDKTKLTLTCERCPEMSVASERIFTQDWIKQDCSIFPGVQVVCKCKCHQLLVYFLCKTNCVPLICIFILSENQVSLMFSEKSKTPHVRICYVQMPSKLSASLKEACLKQADGIKFIVYTCREESVRPTDASRWIARYFLAAVLLLAIYVTRIKISPNRVSPAHGSNSTMVMFFTMTLRCFSPSVTIDQPSEWSQVAVGIYFAVCLSCALGRTVHVLIACRTAHTVMKLFCPMQQQFRALPVTVLFIWLTFSPPYWNKNMKHWFEYILVEGSVGSTLRLWAVLRQLELLATLFCVFVSLSSLLQSILTKLNFLSVFLHVQLVTCLPNSRGPTKYVLVIKINRLI